jgi:uroporphyrinogen-III decarboxylase
VAAAAARSLGVCTYGSTNSPLGSLYGLWGYEGMMLMIGSRPELAEYAARRVLEQKLPGLDALQALGLPLVWIEELFTDQISPSAFRELNVPLMRRLADEIRRRGLRSIYYYCGNPWDRIEDILAVGADALSLEESKKGFRIDIEEVARAVDGRCAIFGNLDSVGILEQGSDVVLEAEVARQVAAGRRNRSRFALSTGSPITPATPLARVRRYAHLIHALGR